MCGPRRQPWSFCSVSWVISVETGQQSTCLERRWSYMVHMHDNEEYGAPETVESPPGSVTGPEMLGLPPWQKLSREREN